jgi:hypothetical protein
LIDVQDKSILKKIDTILSGDAIVARTEGKNLTKSEYVEHIEYFDESVADGSKLIHLKK